MQPITTLEEIIAETDKQLAQQQAEAIFVAVLVAALVLMVLGIVKLLSEKGATKPATGFHRLGVAIGGLTGIVGMLLGLLIGAQETRMGGTDYRLIFAATGGALGFLMAYGLLRLLGWIVDGFVSGGKRR